MKHCLPDCQQPTKVYVFNTYLLSDTIRGATMFIYGSIQSTDTLNKEEKNTGCHLFPAFRFLFPQKEYLYFFLSFPNGISVFTTATVIPGVIAVFSDPFYRGLIVLAGKMTGFGCSRAASALTLPDQWSACGQIVWRAGQRGQSASLCWISPQGSC